MKTSDLLFQVLYYLPYFLIPLGIIMGAITGNIVDGLLGFLPAIMIYIIRSVYFYKNKYKIKVIKGWSRR